MQKSELIQNSIQGKGVDFHITYLHLELLRIDLLIRKAVYRWQKAGQEVGEKFRGLYINEQIIRDLLQLPLGGNWGTGMELSTADETDFDDSEKAVIDELITLKNEAYQLGYPISLVELTDKFRLSQFELDAFLICLAPSIDSRYEKIFGYLQDDVTLKYASIGLIFNLLLPPDFERMRFLEVFHSGPLIKYELIKPIEMQGGGEKPQLRQAFIPTPEIITWLTGQYRPASNFENSIQLISLADEDTSDSLSPDLELDVRMIDEQKPILILYGQDELQQLVVASQISLKLSKPLLSIDLSRIKPENLANHSLSNCVMRDATLTNALPQFTRWEAIQEMDLRQVLFSELNDFDGPLILHSPSVWQIDRNGNKKVKPVIWIKCDIPDSTQRFQLWMRNIGNDYALPVSEIELLAGQFTLTSNQIRNAAFSARDLALQNNRPETIADLYASARQHSSHHLESLAIKIQARYGWDDIVLPEDEMANLHEIAETVRWRSVVLEEWGVGDRLMPNAGVSALFAGPSGTGKTLAAQVIAAELNMDLYKIDLSTVVSKYIGETEKNLERIFSQAHNSNAILFFDEADAIFGKRSEVKDAHDRYANIEVGYLLQRMETYDGVVILATNLRSNLDEAFTRRLQFVVDFPFPDEEERLKIWKVLFPPGVPRETNIDFKSFADRFKLTGGSIRNIIIGAAFLAASQKRPVSTQHILHSLRREMQKMGRLINEKDVAMSK